MKYHIYFPHPTEDHKLFHWKNKQTGTGYNTREDAEKSFWASPGNNKSGDQVHPRTLIRLPDWIYPPESLETWTSWARRQPGKCAAYLENGLCLKPVVSGAVFCSEHIVPEEAKVE